MHRRTQQTNGLLKLECLKQKTGKEVDNELMFTKTFKKTIQKIILKGNNISETIN